MTGNRRLVKLFVFLILFFFLFGVNNRRVSLTSIRSSYTPTPTYTYTHRHSLSLTHTHTRHTHTTHTHDTHRHTLTRIHTDTRVYKVHSCSSNSAVIQNTWDPHPSAEFNEARPPQQKHDLLLLSKRLLIELLRSDLHYERAFVTADLKKILGCKLSSVAFCH